MYYEEEWPSNRRITLERSREIFGNPEPVMYTEDRYDDYTNSFLRKMSVKEWRRISSEEITYFALTLLEGKMQASVFNYLFPLCLNYWYHRLMYPPVIGTSISLQNVLCQKKSLLKEYLSEEQERLVFAFIEDAFLDKFEFSVVYSRTLFDDTWLLRLNTLGYYSEIFPSVWSSLWSTPNIGSSASALYYISLLAFENEEYNPFYYLYPHYRGLLPLDSTDLFECRGAWLNQNVKFFLNTLSYEYFERKLELCKLNLKATKYNSWEFYKENLTALGWVDDGTMRPTSMLAEVSKAYAVNERVVTGKIERLISTFSLSREFYCISD